MTEIIYVITDELGIHARPAGQLVKLAGEFSSSIQIGVGDKLVDAKRVFGVMGLGAKQGDEITVTFDGDDEVAAAQAVKVFLAENF